MGAGLFCRDHHVLRDGVGCYCTFLLLLLLLLIMLLHCWNSGGCCSATAVCWSAKLKLRMGGQVGVYARRAWALPTHVSRVRHQTISAVLLLSLLLLLPLPLPLALPPPHCLRSAPLWEAPESAAVLQD